MGDKIASILRRHRGEEFQGAELRWILFGVTPLPVDRAAAENQGTAVIAHERQGSKTNEHEQAGSRNPPG